MDHLQILRRFALLLASLLISPFLAIAQNHDSCARHLSSPFLRSEQIFSESLQQPAFFSDEDFTVYQILPRVFLYRYEWQRKMTRSFLRVQEHYESPEFKGRFFILKEFKSWYATQSKNRTFSYLTDWGGFNTPSYAFLPFFDGQFKYMVAGERKLLTPLFPIRHEKFYVISTFEKWGSNRIYKRREGTLRHEVAHALFYLDPDYKLKAQQVLARLPAEVFAKMAQRLRNLGYHEDVIEDEAQAYLLSGAHHFTHKSRAGDLIIKIKDLTSAINSMAELFEQTVDHLATNHQHI